MTNPTSSYPMQEYTVVGTRPIHHDGAEKVMGQARYGADIRLPGMLYGQVLRSPHAHATMQSIDTSHAEAISGVSAVLTSATRTATWYIRASWTTPCRRAWTSR